MPNPVAVNDLSPISGSLQTSRISYGVETAGKNYGQAYNSTTWYSDIPNNGQFYTIISDNYTANYYVSRSNAGGAYVEGGLPAVDEYSAPVFWVTVGTSSLDVITIVNGLPDRIGQVPFNSGSQALNWVASSSNYFAVGPDYYEQIDADNLGFCFEGNQIISYPTTGSSWYDISGNGNNGTFQNGGPSFNSNGWLSFDGTDDFIQIPDSATTSNTSSLSICALVKYNSLSSNFQAIIGKGSGSNPDANEEYVLTINNTSLYFDVGQGSGPYINPSLSLTANRWYHISATHARTNSTSSLIAYSNGVALTATTLGALNTPNNNDYPASIGRRAYSGFPYGNDTLNGDLASIQLYLKTLSAAEVAQNYYGGPIITGSLAFAIDAGNLVSYPKSGTAVYTLTGSVNGTLTNGPTFNPTFGGYWNFDGTDDYILLGSSITPGNGNWTLSAWVRGYGGVVGNTSGGPVASGFGIFSSGGYKIFYANYDGSWNYNYGNTTLNPNEWYFLTWVNYTGNTMKMYVNGVADSSVFNSLTSNGGPVDAVGGTQGTPGGTFNGNISLVYWNIGKAFTDDEVLQNYNATR